MNAQKLTRGQQSARTRQVNQAMTLLGQCDELADKLALERADLAQVREENARLREALKGMLDCPAINLENLEDEDVSAIRRAEKALKEAGQYHGK